jgi:hypothetical protein
LEKGSGDQPGRAAIHESTSVSLKGQGEHLAEKTADIPTENYGGQIVQRGRPQDTTTSHPAENKNHRETSL